VLHGALAACGVGQAYGRCPVPRPPRDPLPPPPLRPRRLRELLCLLRAALL